MNHWNKEHGAQTYERYKPDRFREIADNIVAYQNADGGWPKNLDMLARLDPDSVKAALKPRHRLSTLDNANVYTQVEYLSNVYLLTGDTLYRNSARRGMEYMLSAPVPQRGLAGLGRRRRDVQRRHHLRRAFDVERGPLRKTPLCVGRR